MLLDFLLRVGLLFVFFVLFLSLGIMLLEVLLAHDVVVERHEVNELDALARVLGQHALDDFSSHCRDRFLLRELDLLFLDLFDQVAFVTRVERQEAIDHSEEHDTDGPDVDCGACGRCYFLKAFRSHVGQGACIDFVVAHASDTKVDDFDSRFFLVLVLEKHIL